MIRIFTYCVPSEYRGRGDLDPVYRATGRATRSPRSRQPPFLRWTAMLGLKGWQWIFIIEALPAVLLGFVVLRAMTDRPALADWLAPEEKTWLQTRIDGENRQVERTGGRLKPAPARSAIPACWRWSAIYLMSVTCELRHRFLLCRKSSRASALPT